jgi:hypothetical protein
VAGAGGLLALLLVATGGPLARTAPAAATE